MPILEENQNHVIGKKSNCNQQSSYNLLKEFKAPVHYVSNWTNDLNQILKKEFDLTAEQRMNRRIKIYNWYENFKVSMRSRFIEVINDKFN